MVDLKDKVALVTGATSGIGKAVALIYAQHGAKVMVTGRDQSRGLQVVEQIRDFGGAASFFQADLCDPAQCEALVEKTVSEFGKLDIACNNAGTAGDLNAVADYPVETWNRIIDINLNSVFYCLKYELRIMQQQKTPASIVNMSSILGHVGEMGLSSYVASKHAILGLTKSAALENATTGIRINCVSPAYIQTPILEVLPLQTREALASAHPVSRLGRPEEVAEIVLWLSSDKASFATGGSYNIDGGYLAR